MPSVEYDLNFMQIGVVDLEGYLLSKETYWPVVASAPAGEPPYPRLTLGALLLSKARLDARLLTGDAQARYSQLRVRLEIARQKWAVAWENKAAKEFSSRLLLWRNYIEDYREDADANADRYAYEVQRRAMLQLLQEQAPKLDPTEQALLDGLDKALEAVFVRGNFIWEPEVQGGFPESIYWYLYGRPKRDIKN